MKKWRWLSVAFLAVAVVGTKNSAGNDVAKLQPVQVVCMSRSGNDITVWTDTGDQGVGDSLQSAVEDMTMSAAKDIFLETADHLLLMPDCIDLLKDAATLLRPSCTLCLLDGEPDMEQIGQFLELHAPEVTIMEYRAGTPLLQILKTTDGRMRLVS